MCNHESYASAHFDVKKTLDESSECKHKNLIFSDFGLFLVTKHERTHKNARIYQFYAHILVEDVNTEILRYGKLQANLFY